MMFKQLQPEPEPKPEHSSNGYTMTFPQKLMDVLSRPDTSDSIVWMPDGLSFIIISPQKLVQNVMPRFFNLKSTKLASFKRKLNRWGFKCTNDGTYYHPNFKRGDYKTCLQMRCCHHKNPKSRPSLSEELILSPTANPTIISPSPTSFDNTIVDSSHTPQFNTTKELGRRGRKNTPNIASVRAIEAAASAAAGGFQQRKPPVANNNVGNQMLQEQQQQQQQPPMNNNNNMITMMASMIQQQQQMIQQMDVPQQLHHQQQQQMMTAIPQQQQTQQAQNQHQQQQMMQMMLQMMQMMLAQLQNACNNSNNSNNNNNDNNQAKAQVSHQQPPATALLRGYPPALPPFLDDSNNNAVNAGGALTNSFVANNEAMDPMGRSDQVDIFIPDTDTCGDVINKFEEGEGTPTADSGDDDTVETFDSYYDDEEYRPTTAKRYH